MAIDDLLFEGWNGSMRSVSARARDNHAASQGLEADDRVKIQLSDVDT